MRVYRQSNGVNTREELIELLKGYQRVLATPMLNYLNSLIELDFSVIQEYICDEDRKALGKLEIYKKIAIYNIYTRAIDLFRQIDVPFTMRGSESGCESLSISIPIHNKDVRLFYFDYSEPRYLNYSSVPVLNEMRVGTISLYQTLESVSKREAELNRVMSELERLYDARNPYSVCFGRVGEHGVQWNLERDSEIARYERLFLELDGKKEATLEEKEEIEVTNQIRSLLLKDYGLTNKSFRIAGNRVIDNLDQSKSKLQKVLVRKQDNFVISSYTKYV